MSVLACNRKGCENIMCVRYSPTFGYICDDCFEELVNTPGVTIESFMKSKKTEDKNAIEFRREYLSEIFEI